MPSSVTYRESGTFNECSSHEEIPSITHCFWHQLKRRLFPSCVAKIVPYKFNKCSEIEELFSPSFVTEICKNAF